MYSYEITKTLELQNYNLDSETYINICRTSPQISRVKYDPHSNSHEIWTNDDNYWRFSVHIKGE